MGPAEACMHGVHSFLQRYNRIFMQNFSGDALTNQGIASIIVAG
mgnify:FL=1